MLHTIIDSFMLMPGWAQFLVAWPLPSLICVLGMITILFKDDLNSRHIHHREQAIAMIWFFTIFWPLFVFLMLTATVIETYELIPRLWKRFGKWAERKQQQHQARVRLKAQPKSKPQKEYVHYFDIPNARTLCGVGNPANVTKGVNIDFITCPICLGIIKRNQKLKTPATAVNLAGIT